ncbi:MAG: DUF58 domain-containing protein [Planctomycetes bacterium]|nr:DUF58 domain-containing protein [Planctomycetota bacterium]MBI3836253.1 DUF58 domain-containing protein [Planctomycetota bacterium]
MDYRRYLNPVVLAKIGGLELRARLIVEGFFTGIHHSPHRGLSVEFADHRVYSQGDDLRHIDWKVYGKTDKYYIKEYEQETNLNVMLVVDCSESMNYRSHDDLMTKHDYATSAAAAIAYLTLQQQDSVGLALFDEHLSHFHRPSNNATQWRTLVHELAGKTGPAKTSIGRVLAELAERLQHRLLIVLISDLFDSPDAILKGLKQLRYRRHEVIVWNILDPAELTLPFTGPTMFEGLESSGKLLTDPRSIRARYVEEVEHFQSQLRMGCGHMLVDYALFDTSAGLEGMLSGYLSTRSARLRQRSSRIYGGG